MVHQLYDGVSASSGSDEDSVMSSQLSPVSNLIVSMGSGGTYTDDDLPCPVQFDSTSPQVDMVHNLMRDNRLVSLKADGFVDMSNADDEDD